MSNDDLPEPLPLSRVTQRILRASEAIALEEIESITFQHTVLCQTSLPYRPVRERQWLRRNGNILLLVKAGEVLAEDGRTFKEVPLPHGSRARLVLMYLNREAVRQRSQLIEIDRSLTAFTKRLINRAPNSRDIAVLKAQLGSLSVATVRLGLAGENRRFQINTQIVDGFDLWAPRNPNQECLWPSIVELNKPYFESLVEHAVPLDERAIGALQNSALALDVYAWFAQRLHRIKPGRAQFIPWPRVQEQFGAGYARLRDFRAFFLAQLRAVLTQYPEARVEADEKGLWLRHSPPPVPPRLITGPHTTLDAGDSPRSLGGASDTTD